ncbi:MAG: DinB family protein [Promethearchaeota archaeon]
MVSKKKLLLDQLANTHNEPGWFPTLHEALDSLSSTQATWRSNENSHSIWEIVNHLIYWNDVYLNRYKKSASQRGALQNELTFTQPEVEKSEENWLKVTTQVDQIFDDWRKAVYESSESDLDSLVSEEQDGLWWNAISNLCLHNSYHIGQIVAIRKQQNAWINKY